VNLGFNSQHVLTLQVNRCAARRQFFGTLLVRLAALPEVEAVGATSGPPMGAALRVRCSRLWTRSQVVCPELQLRMFRRRLR